ncbi:MULTISPECIES: hypothetical protein [Cyanophyceae]|uniref:hypothetical protein n=1 Tax=Cyanophyceae TaxID=3028117 RepID=UPI0016887C58|nr:MULTISPECIES: hypothetical protein [Cyanophyceae]MBD1914633.1 hypothetical protein [Phormidium sp. FACHB-77]MBD2030552.1 hypothetical protein [Phormidium sp. FACHB-322]MBD2052405.1 hypothetical protein [Leptolyngbya sp. FACHB-60]
MRENFAEEWSVLLQAPKQLLVNVATKVAEARREGGLSGIGSSRISDKEGDVLNKMSAALGLVV